MPTPAERKPDLPSAGHDPADGVRRWRTAFDPRALLLASALVVLSGLLGAALLTFQRDQSLAEGQRLTDVFAQLMDEQTSRTLQTLDQRLELISLDIGAMERSGTFSESTMRAKLEPQLVHLPFVISLAVLDAQGQVRFDSATSGDRASQSNEAYFRIYQTRPGAEFYLGTPRRVGQPSKWVLHAARPIHDDTGRLTGVVVATVLVTYFDRLWQSLALESGSALALLRTDGTMMLRSPHSDTAMNRSFGNEPLFTQYLPFRSSGHFRQHNPIDGSARLAAYRTLERYPDLLVVVARTLGAVLEPWHQLARMVIGGWLLASGLVIALAIHVGRISAKHREAENTTRQMAQRLSVASDAAGIVLWDWDVRTGHWFATPTFHTTLGYPPQDGTIAFDFWFSLIHPDDKSVAQTAVDAIRNVANARYAYEIRLRHADGSYRWVQTSGQVIERAADGKPTRLIGVRLDITERKLAELERRQVLERITVGFVALDAQWRYTYVNQQAGVLLERDPASLIGKSAWDAFPPQPGETFHQVCQQAMADQKPAWLEAFYPDLGRWIEDHIYPSPEGVSIYFSDITQRKTSEIELRLAKEHAENLIANANVMIVGLNDTGQITLFNQAAQDLTGYSFADLAGRNWFEVLAPRQRFPQVWAEFERLSADGMPRQFENPILTISGQERLISWRNSAVREGDRTVGTMSFGIDVTTRRQAELALAESKEQFEVLAQHSLQGIALVRKAQVIYVNPALCAIAGRSADELARFSVAQLRQWIHPQDSAASTERWRRAMRGDLVTDLVELRIQHASGQWRWIQAAARTITLGDEPALLAMVVDIHERKVAEHALRDSEELMRQMAESVSQMFWLFDIQQNRYLYISPAAQRVLGYTAASLLAEPQAWRRNIHALDQDRYRAELARLITTDAYDTEVRVWHPDGSLHWLHLRAYPILGPHQTPYRMAGVTEDITDRKTLELREEQERDILQYLASGRPMAEILDKFVLTYEAMLPGAKGSVLLMDPDGEHLRHGGAPHLPLVYCQAIDGVAIGPAAGSCGTAAFTGDAVMVADIAADPRWVDYRALALAHQLRACWSVPIKGTQGQVLGTFAFYFDHVRSATPAELSTIERGAQLASQALERNLAVQAMRESEARYRTLVEWSPEGIGVHQNGVLTYANPAAAAILGARSARDLIGKPMNDFVHPDDRTDLQKDVDAILADGGSTPLVERRYLKLDGTVIDVETKGGSILINGATAVLVVVRDITARKKEQTALRDSRQQLRVLSSRILATQETERRRVAHELHDELGQALTSIKINLQADDRLTQGAGSGLFAENIRIVEEALQHVRGLALALRPPMLDDLGLSPSLRWLTAQTATRSGLQVQLHAPASLGRLDPDLETAIFRIVQEALTNIVRHAQASLAQVTVSVIDLGALQVQVQDDGVGFDVPAMRQRATEGNSMGVLGMQERASLAGAELSIVSNPGQGCTVTLLCPVRAAAPAA